MAFQGTRWCWSGHTNPSCRTPAITIIPCAMNDASAYYSSSCYYILRIVSNCVHQRCRHGRHISYNLYVALLFAYADKSSLSTGWSTYSVLACNAIRFFTPPLPPAFAVSRFAEGLTCRNRGDPEGSTAFLTPSRIPPTSWKGACISRGPPRSTPLQV